MKEIEAFKKKYNKLVEDLEKDKNYEDFVYCATELVGETFDLKTVFKCDDCSKYFGCKSNEVKSYGDDILCESCLKRLHNKFLDNITQFEENVEEEKKSLKEFEEEVNF